MQLPIVALTSCGSTMNLPLVEPIQPSAIRGVGREEERKIQGSEGTVIELWIATYLPVQLHCCLWSPACMKAAHRTQDTEARRTRNTKQARGKYGPGRDDE